MKHQAHACRLPALLILLAATGGCGRGEVGGDEFPSRPIKVVVPFTAGGGTDTYARIFKQAIDEHDLLPQPLVVINQGGAGATIGSRTVKNAAPDGYTVLLLHDAILTAKLAGAVSYGAEAFQPVAGTGEVGMVIAVDEGSDFQTLDDLLDGAARAPDTLAFGANIGALTHFAGLQLEQLREGAMFRFAQIGGGADRFASLKAGHIAVTGFSIEEFVRFRSDGLRGLAYFGEQRHEAAPDVPTAREQGYDLLSRNTFYWWYPKGTPQERVEYFAGVLEEALQTDLVQEKMKEIHCLPLMVRGAELQARLDDSLRRLSEVSPRKIVTLPRLPPILAGFAGLLAAAAAVQVARSPRSPAAEGAAPRRRIDLAAAVFGLTAAYVLVLSRRWLDFRLATIAYVVLTGGLLAGRRPRRLAVVAAAAVAVGVGVHYVFTQLFVVDLP